MKRIIALLFISAIAQAGTYEYILNPDGSVVDGTIKRLSDGTFIPRDPNNRDYHAFLTDATRVIQMPQIPVVVDPGPSLLDRIVALETHQAVQDTAITAVEQASGVQIDITSEKPAP